MMITVQSVEMELPGIYVKDVYNALFELDEVFRGVDLFSKIEKKEEGQYTVEILVRRFGLRKVIKFEIVVMGIPFWQVAYLTIGSIDAIITIRLQNTGTGTRISVESNIRNEGLGRKMAAKLADDMVTSVKTYLENRFMIKRVVPVKSLIEHLVADVINDKSRMFADITSSARLMMSMNLINERRVWINQGDLLPTVLKFTDELNGEARGSYIFMVISFADGPRFKFLLKNGKIEAAACEEGEKLSLGLSALEEAARANGEAVILQYRSITFSPLKPVIL